MARILGLGDNTIDTYVDAGVQYPGGNAVNVAVLSHRRGAEAAYLGCVGDDEGGALLLSALRAEGVDVSRVRTRPGANARARLGHREGDRYFIGSTPGVRADYRLEAADFAYIAGFDLAHTSIFSDLGEAWRPIREAARLLAFDFSTSASEAVLGRFAPDLDYAFLSAANETDEEVDQLIARILGLGARHVVVTRGAKGACAGAGRGVVRQAARPIDVVDTLGAGDGFISAFLVARLDGASLEDALRAGAEFAAQVCTWAGGFGHGRPWPDAEAAQD